jgi:hypothetical protein
MSSGSETRLSVKVGSRAATCPAALGSASQPRWTLGLPRVPQLWTRSEDYEAPRVLRLRIQPPEREGFGLPRVLRLSVGRGTQRKRKGQHACPCNEARKFPTHTHTFPRRMTSGSSWACKTCGLTAQTRPARHTDRHW